MEQEVLRVDFARPMPLFPLPNCVLLPHAAIPLHIFEPRYRAMTSACLEGPALIAMACFEGDEWVSNYDGKPLLRPYVCVGNIVQHKKFKDGRYDLLMHGVCRARIIEEVEHDPYRQALLEPTEHQATMEIDLEENRRRIDAFLRHPLLEPLASIRAIYNWLNPEVPTVAMVDRSIMMLCTNHEQRYTMLAEADPQARTQWLEELLRQTHRTMSAAERLGPGRDEEGTHLN
jgi:Lon protease-like protein